MTHLCEDVGFERAFLLLRHRGLAHDSAQFRHRCSGAAGLHHARSGAAKPGALADTSEPQERELLDATPVPLHRTQRQIEDKRLNLAPRIAVTVEIKTGSRPITEYLLSPMLQRCKHESLRDQRA